MDKQVARTRLEQLIGQRRLTIGEFTHIFNRTAATLTHPASNTGKVTISRRQAIRWVTGDISALPHPASCRVLERMFRETAEELFGPPHPSEPEATSADGPRTGDNCTVPAKQVVSPGGDHASRTSQASWSPGAWDDIEGATSMAAAESAKFGQFAEQTNVGPHTIEQFHADLRRIANKYPNHSVYPIFVELRELRNRTFDLLEGRQTPAQSRDLYLTAAGFCALLSNASFDLGCFDAAETQARTAFLAAELAGHNGMRSWIRGTQALIAYWDDRPQTAVDLAQDGWRYLPENGTARVRLACIEARARARLRDAAGTEDALQRAELAREAIISPDDPGGMMAFPIAKQHFYGGAARLWLGGATNLAEAEQLAAEAVQLYEGAPPGERRVGEMSLARLDLAVARIAQSDLDAAAEQVELVLEIGGRRRTESIARRLHQLAAALERPHLQTSALAVSMRERISCSPIRTQPAISSSGGTP
ncbi:hypothetical protein [Nocardia blacklockiae]|uniref:hypothetical protein n=1 Tax=Nocardia blacklockiae TaxID=480036 RepID=UPI001892E497|nr:hypothetical protein [Nocardia blacklockiae]MBF6176782.1 hypothetical protein [Nocardia blacklockiae]